MRHSVKGQVMKQAAKDQDKFVVRLPPGMRDRIKSKADRAGMSMNEAIVWCLNSFFPAPQTFEGRVEELAELVAMMKESGRENAVLDELINRVHQTVQEVADGRLETSPDFKGSISDRLSRWDEEQIDRYRDEHESPFDDRIWDTTSWSPPDDGLGDLDDEDPKV